MFISNYQFETSLPDASQCAFQENEIYTFKDTLREISSSNKTQVFTKNMTVSIWVVGTLSQLIIRVFTLKSNFFKNKVVSGKTKIFCDRSSLYSPF